jgi:hypothetical protein
MAPKYNPYWGEVCMKKIIKMDVNAWDEFGMTEWPKRLVFCHPSAYEKLCKRYPTRKIHPVKEMDEDNFIVLTHDGKRMMTVFLSDFSVWVTDEKNRFKIRRERPRV